MVHLNMLSNTFAHAHCSTWWKRPKNLTWDFFSKKNNISVYVDNDMFKGFSEANDGKLKFLWLLESRKFDGGVSNNIVKHLDKIINTFEEIWTHNNDLLKLHDKFKWAPAYGTYIEDIQIFPKSKNISMITSDKQLTPQHVFRYQFAINNKNKIDVFGRGFNQIEKKESGLRDYMFSVAIENDTYDTYFTEKILDCFATGTIPIFKGTKKIVEHYNPDGIIFLDDCNLDDLTVDLYESKKGAIKENFNKVKELDTLDDWLFEKYIKKYL